MKDIKGLAKLWNQLESHQDEISKLKGVLGDCKGVSIIFHPMRIRSGESRIFLNKDDPFVKMIIADRLNQVVDMVKQVEGQIEVELAK